MKKETQEQYNFYTEKTDELRTILREKENTEKMLVAMKRGNVQLGSEDNRHDFFRIKIHDKEIQEEIIGVLESMLLRIQKKIDDFSFEPKQTKNYE